MGAQMVREVASKTFDVAGDGTTTRRGSAGHLPEASRCRRRASPTALKRDLEGVE